MKTLRLFILGLVLILGALHIPAMAQPTWTLDPFGKEKKPEKYEEKMLGSEKTATKKFSLTRRLIQNTVTHYNYYFNANSKLNTVIERAKLSHKDDYSRLLTFYPYTLENTATQQVELDSIIYKSTAGILLHDLRNDWVDNLYLLIGKSYYFRKTFDSAALTFQFINYNLFPRKKGEDDNRVVGTNQSAAAGTISIADKEKRNAVQKAFTLPPSRNDALIWLARTLVETGDYGDAAGMLNILQQDPNLPTRLQNDLAEVTAYWFYQQGIYDSTAKYLEKALTNAQTKQDRARWEYLLGQLYEMSGQFEKAGAYYGDAAKHTVDPVMDIYSRLNDAKLYKKSGNTQELQKAIDNLLKMARKDKYENYRDVIYHAAGQIGMELPDTANSVTYFRKSVQYNTANAEIKNKSYLQLGHIAYEQAQYKDALNYYDSLDLSNPVLKDDSTLIDDRRKNLVKVVQQLSIIQMEDSLQMIAAMAPAERDAYVKKLARKLRKEKGQKDDDRQEDAGPRLGFSNDKNAPSDLFEQNSSKGEWYFHNAGMKSKGFNEFKSKWGKRENVDNWRRKAATEAATRNLKSVSDDPLASLDGKDAGKDDGAGKPLDNSYDALMGTLPLTPELVDSSNARIANALLELARVFQYDLQDYDQAIYTYDIYLQRFPDKLENGEVYMGLYYCYMKLNNTEKADYYRNLINTKFAGTKSAQMINNPLLLQADKKNPEVTAKYEAIYDQFIEGKFDEALRNKQQADSLYGDHYWSPQLLYIESLFHIRNRNDSQAIRVLTQLIQKYADSPLKSKAETMIDVLKRRDEIEAYLSKLEVTRAEEEKYIFPEDKTLPGKNVNEPVKTNEPKKIVTPAPVPVIQPSAPIALPPSMVSGGFSWQADKPHYMMMILEKTDGVYINEARNAFNRFNRQRYSSRNISITRDAIDADRALLIFTGFKDAQDAYQYYEVVKKAAKVEVSWLPANKYSFIIISEQNLQELKKNPDLPAYRKLLNNQFPGQF
ncbi:MAG TPA: hypothetical protein DHV17_01565 [Chitinophagaceae bacterium]|nr:hypothetical protein [Chitinophagaceae bacterium]